MSVYYLNANDFSPENGHLAANIGGISLVMFHSQRCTHCVNFLGEFKQLPSAIRGVNFCLCSVDDANASIVQMSRQSSTPIEAVPKFILYNDGIPYVLYDGQRNMHAIIAFLQEIIAKLNQKQSFTRPTRSRQQPQAGFQQTPNAPPAQGISRPAALAAPVQQQQQQQNTGNKPFVIAPTTGVKEYESSYGRPYNTLNEQDFLEYETAYLQQMSKAIKK